MLVLVAAGYLIYHSFRNVTAPPPPPGCQAGTGVQAIDLDPEQAEVAATIAGVAARHRLPRQAVTIALAAALQESKLHNLDYGDRDSVGIFQQRPSEGWGSATQLQDPVYATTKFYTALAKVPRLHRDARLPGGAGGAAQRGRFGLPAVDRHRQAADRLLHRKVTAQRVLLVHPGREGEPGGGGAADRPDVRAGRAESRRGADYHGPFGPEKEQHHRGPARPAGRGWTVASWLVAHAQAYRLSQVRYAGFTWKAASGSMGWQRQSNPTSPSGKTGIVAG